MNVLQPGVSWIQLSEERVQVLLPDGDHITISGDANDVISGLELLKVGDEASPHEDQPLFSDLFAVLDGAGAIRTGPISSIGSTLDEYAELHSFKRCRMLSKALLPLTAAEVRGDSESVIYQMMSDLLSKEKFSNKDSRQLDIVCADWEDYTLFHKANDEAVQADKPVLFIRWLGDELVIGPLVYTKDGPCYECFIARRKASVNYVDEYIASTQQPPTILKKDFTFESFFNYTVGRYLRLLSNGAFHLTPIGGIERWDPIRGNKKESLVHKIPKCDKCGLVKKGDPLVRVRDLL